MVKFKKDMLDNGVLGKWSVNPDTGLIDVDGSVHLSIKHTPNGKLPVSFGRVSDNFICCYCDLSTLRGSPHWVGGKFDCSHNSLSNLKYAPKHIGGYISIVGNVFKKLDWDPDYIGEGIYLGGGFIDLSIFIYPRANRNILIPEFETLIKKGFEIRDPYTCYYPYRDVYYRELERRLAELL